MRNHNIVALVFLVLGCRGEAVEWSETIYSNPRSAPSEFPRGVRPELSSGCAQSLRVTTSDRSAFAAWWQTRRDSSATLMVARSVDSGPWETAVIADSTDKSARGCGRPPPAIAADAKSGYVHLTFFSEPPSGAGVFFAHSMDRAATFHAAVPIVFGNNPSRVSIDAQNQRVVIAFEDPNSLQPMIGVSLSGTMGHIFERRMRASSSNGRARQPVVRLGGDSIHLWWSEYSANPAISSTRPAYRRGYIQPQ